MNRISAMTFVSLLGLTLAYAASADTADFSEVRSRRQAVSSRYGAGVQAPPKNQPVGAVYGRDDRHDWSEEKRPFVLDLANSTSLVAWRSELQNGLDGYRLRTEPWTAIGNSELCATEKFRGQPQAGFCTAFLVSSDLVVTAGHCLAPQEVTEAAFVFGFAQKSTGSTSTRFDRNQVYFGKDVVAHGAGGIVDDYILIRLDRRVQGRKPIPIRREGQLSQNTPVGVIGHPQGLPSKIAFSATTKVARTGTGWFRSSLDTFAGNSGSPVFNAHDGVVEGILVRGRSDFHVRSSGCASSSYYWPFEAAELAIATTQFAQHVPNLFYGEEPDDD